MNVRYQYPQHEGFASTDELFRQELDTALQSSGPVITDDILYQALRKTFVVRWNILMSDPTFSVNPQASAAQLETAKSLLMIRKQEILDEYQYVRHLFVKQLPDFPKSNKLLIDTEEGLQLPEALPRFKP